MKGRVVCLDHIGGREAAALVVDGRLEDLLLAPRDGGLCPGAVCRAIADRPIKGMGGIFLRLPEGRTGFLRQAARGVAPGAGVLVQVSGFAEPGKALPVTQNIRFKSRAVIVTPNRPGINLARSIRDDDLRDELLVLVRTVCAEGPAAPSMGVIVRSSAATLPPEAVAQDLAETLALAGAVLQEAEGAGPELLLDGPSPHLIAWREWSAPAPDAIEDRPGCLADHAPDIPVDLLADPVALPGQATLYVEATRALVAVDVNTGGAEGALAANLACCKALPRVLRVRGLGGQIVIDFAPLSKRDRPKVETALKAAFRSDPVDTALVGWTPLGHFEMQRKRERLPITMGDFP